MSDPLYWLTSLVLNFEGTDGASSAGDFVDISPDPKTVSTVTGAAQLDTGVTPVSGTGSLLLSGGSASIRYAANADFDFGTGGVGTGDFCLELWWRPTAVGATQMLLAYTNPTVPSGTDYAFSFYQNTTGKIVANVQNGSSNFGLITSTTTMVANTWHHLAYVRSNGVCSLYVNGVSEGGTANALVAVNTPASRILQIGTQASANYATGSIDGVRITKGNPRYTSNFSLALPTALFVASDPETGEAALSAPTGVIASAGGGYADLSAPAGTLSTSAGAQTTLTSPMGALSATGGPSANTFEVTAQMGTLNAATGATAGLSSPVGTLVASITVPITVRADLVGPTGLLLASGTVAVSVRANLMLNSAGALVAQAGGHADLDAPAGTLYAVASAGILARFDGAVSMGELHAMATSGVVVHAALVAPLMQPTTSAYAALTAPMGTLLAYGETVISVTYEAYATNLKPFEVRGQETVHEVTRYTNFPFNQVLRFKNSYLGLADDGMYVLGGTTDAGDPIEWAWKTAMGDSGTSYKKTVLSVYFGGRIGQASTVTLYKDESDSTDYDYTTPRDTSPKNYRQKFGRGTKTRYFAIGVAGDTELDLDTMEFEINKLTRRI